MHRLAIFCALVSFSFAFSAFAEDSCKPCHAIKYKTGHFPVSQGNCTACHQADPEHLKGNAPKAVTTVRNTEICYACHDRVDNGPIVHPALQMSEDSCYTCHDPHGTPNPKLLVDKLPNLCFSCHDSSMATGNSVHNIMNNEKSCSACHNPHSAPRHKLLSQEPSDLCLSCHDKAIVTQERIIPNIKAKIYQPYRMETGGECLECHSPHATNNSRILKLRFPPNNYNRYNPGDATTPNTYALCYDCHDVGALKPRPNDKNPETNFRIDVKNGNQIVRKSLHWVHVTNEPGTTGPRFGRSCKICHDIHGSPQEHMIKVDIAPGAPVLKYTARVDGGECSGSCHNVMRYTRIVEEQPLAGSVVTPQLR